MLKYVVLLYILVSGLYASNQFIIDDDSLIDKRAEKKIFEIGSEVKQKLGVNIYISLKEDNGIDPELDIKQRRVMMKQYENTIRNKVQKPYVVLAISINQMYANVLYSQDLQKVIDRDDILDNYVIPLLASKDKNSLFAKSSAATLNGYAQIADSLAAAKNIKLKSSIGSEGKVASSVWKVFMYSVVVFGILAYIAIVMRERKYTK